jgi:predicted transposase YbfD/YdcC
LPKKTFQLIVERGGECLIQLKANQPTIFKQAEAIAKQQTPQKSRVFYDKGHGRLESRKVSIYSFEPEFPHVRTLVAIDRQRENTKNGKIEEERALYLFTMKPDKCTPEQCNELVRGHWGGVENRNHWRRDAILEEDKTRTKNATISTTLALLRNTFLAALARYEEPLNLGLVKQLCSHDPQIALDMLLSEKLPRKLKSNQYQSKST